MRHSLFKTNKNAILRLCTLDKIDGAGYNTQCIYGQYAFKYFSSKSLRRII